MNFRKLINSDYLSADDFVDESFNPLPRVLTIKDVTMDTPPNGKKQRACFHFTETEKRAFIANGEIKKFARGIRCAETNKWKGYKLTISSAPKRMAGQDTTGMVIVKWEAPNAPK